ncbi:MAG: hypothetical protein HOM68_22110 [Gemmatimonadetes bacterium]|jgi:hypothetical protein|nr:hypothetical protein [Gemmatimonadota bacterium]MBT5145503.1 hypothetical protein [Gemmatimonadota bacterium]MBT5591691.1 hypothetical protein [Gemmatimonadota bacterium]MBT5961854.1 hypothetical protein [Gemmatimonadota bacterium]MBT6626839.1 hypothetical protein [Gemmatimonadota bacterium]
MQLLMWGVTLAVVSLTSFCQAQDTDAYRLDGKSIRVDRASLWANWIYQNDLVAELSVPVKVVDILHVDTDGLRPVFFRKHINVAPDAETFAYPDYVRAGGSLIPGGATAKSNDSLSRNVLDGDLTTFWEPDTPPSFASRLTNPGDFNLDGLREWEIELDMGRLVYADSVTLVFPSSQFSGEFLGQPVKSFALFASMGERFPFPVGNNLRYDLIEQTTTGSGLVPVAGTDGRYVQMTFELFPLDTADWDLDGVADITGGFIQYIRVNVTDSDLWRDSFLGAGEEARLAYEALPAVQRGAIAYQRRTAGGLFVELQDGDQSAPERYHSLPEEKRGPISYYTKEVPRIAEVQVWATGDNYALQPEKRAGASVVQGDWGSPGLATDGLYDTEYQARVWSPLYARNTAWYDLGAVFWVDNVSVVSRRKPATAQGGDGAFLGPHILVSDGTQLKPLRMNDRRDFAQLEDGLKWDNIISEEHVDNSTPRVRVFRETFPRRKIRFLQVRNTDITGELVDLNAQLATVGAIQLYGEGYPTSVWAYSPPIALTDNRGEFIRRALPRIAWDGDAVIREHDPISGEDIERIEPLSLHPDVRLQLQTRTSDQTDTNFTYYQVVVGSDTPVEVTKEIYDAIELEWTAWNIWQTLAASQKHESRTDDDGDGHVDEDPIDLIDNDGDGLIDEDGKKLRRAPRLGFDRSAELAFVGWSEWSESYLPTNGINEATITSPNPRKFLQVRVNLLSEDPFKTARISNLRIDLAPPLALELAGELALLSDEGATRSLIDLGVLAADYAPPRDINPLEAQQFSYFIRAAAPDATQIGGFNEVLIVTPRPARLTGIRLGQVAVETVSLAGQDQVRTSAVTTRFDHAFVADGDGILRSEDGSEQGQMELVQMATAADSIWVRFPFSLNADLPDELHALIEVQFESQSFREGLQFTSSVRASDSDEGVFQRVDTDGMDATELVDSSTARVSLLASGRALIQDVVMASVFTPNGDGINDELTVSFALLKVSLERPLGVAFYDLSGRLVGRGLEEKTTGKAGEQIFTWDGRDLDGQVVAPGIYLCRIEVEADDGDSRLMRLVHIAY